MGGVLAINLATRSKIPKIKAIITIDCVEDAHKEYEKLQSEISSEKVTLFTSIESAVQWYKAENPNVSSKLAEVSMTPRLKKQNNARLVYKMPFEATRNYWQGWFENMSEKFLSVKTYKISFLAGSGNGNNLLLLYYFKLEKKNNRYWSNFNSILKLSFTIFCTICKYVIY